MITSQPQRSWAWRGWGLKSTITQFMGIGSEVYQSVKMGRKGIGFELKESYFDLAKANLKAVVSQKNQVGLFDAVQ